MRLKPRVMRAMGVLFALFAILFGSVAPASATGNTLSLPGFATMQSTLTATQKSAIRAYVSSNPGATSVSCVGYAGFNYLGEQRQKIVALARARAQAACNYAAAQSGATVGAVTYILSTSKKANIRKAVLTFTAAVAAGRYVYSMSNLDAGTVMHGGPVTGYFHEGDLVASTFAETSWSLDSNTPPEYGQMGTINGGSAAYFDHWNTAADDTGTSYRIGDRLGPIPAGTTVTLYAIAATG